jgi:hypothetical protein
MKVPWNLGGSGESQGKQDSKNQGFKGSGNPSKNFFHFEDGKMKRQKKFGANHLAGILGIFTAVAILGAAGFSPRAFPVPFEISRIHAQGPYSSPTAGKQKESGEKARDVKEADLKSSSKDDPSAKVSDAESFVRLRARIEQDRKELEKVKADLKARQKAFDQATGALKKLDKALEKKKEELQAIQGKESSAETSRLSVEIKKLQGDYDLEKKRSELLLQAVKTMQEQINSLERKIQKDLRALERLAGKETPKEKEPSVPRKPPSKPDQATGPTAPLPLPPGVKLPEAQPPAGEEQKVPEKPATEPATAEQIEARREAERKKEKPLKAGEAIVEVVERKQALEDQIKVEKKLLQTIEEGKNYLEGILASRENDLRGKMAAGAGIEELGRIRQEIAGLRKKISELVNDMGKRNARLNDLNKELEQIEAEQVKAVEEADRKRREAEAARERRLWLESPVHPQNIWRWAKNHAPQMILALITIAVLLLVIRIFASCATSRGGRTLFRTARLSG